MTSSPASARSISVSFGTSAPVMFTPAASPRTDGSARVTRGQDHVVSGGAVDDHVVGGAVPHAVDGEIDIDFGHVGAAEVVDGRRVGSAERVQVDDLDVVDVHDDVADIAGEAQPVAVGGEVEQFGDVGAVEEQFVGAVLALDGVAAVTRVPLEDVVAGAQEAGVVPLVAVDEVVAVAAEQRVGSVAAEERVVARPAVDRDRDQCGQVPGGGEAVVAAVGVEDQLLGGADVDRERRRVEPVEAHARAVGGRRELLRAVAAVDLDGVGAVTALVEVGVVAGVPDHPVVAGLTEHLVVGVTPGERVVLGAPEQEVEAALAEERVVTGLPEERDRRRSRR